MDAVVYKWALELEGVDVESIFRDTSNVNGDLDIDTKTRIGVVFAGNSCEVVKRIPEAQPVDSKRITKRRATRRNN